MAEKCEARIIEITGKCAADCSFKIVEIKIKKHQKVTTIEIIADKPQGGITIGDCAMLNKKIGNALEEEDFIEDAYTVEISSPGLDRPLVTLNDFKRNVGREVEFYLNEPQEDKKFIVGSILNAFDGQVEVKTKTEEIKILISKIDKAIQVLNFK